MVNSVSIWVGRPSGVDPTRHLWFDHAETGTPHRVCDGAIWVDGQEADDEPVPLVPCHLCRETYLTDVLHGHRLLTISLEGRPTPVFDGGIPTKNGPTSVECGPIPVHNGMYYLGEGEGVMPERRISVFDFAEFCEAKPSGQDAMVLKIRGRTLVSKKNKGFNYYGPLLSLVRRTHWATNDLANLEAALPHFLNGQSVASTAANYQCMADAYIRFWRDRATNFFPVPMPVDNLDTAIEGLVIRVRPEVGMQTRDGDRQILKLWCRRLSPPRQVRLIVGHLMGKVNPNPQWHSGIWDIRQRNIPLPLLPPDPDGFDAVLGGYATAFLRIWEKLDEEALNREEDDLL